MFFTAINLFFFYFHMVCLILLFGTFFPLVVRYLIHFLLLGADIFPISILEIMPHLSFVLLKFKKTEKKHRNSMNVFVILDIRLDSENFLMIYDATMVSQQHLCWLPQPNNVGLSSSSK